MIARYGFLAITLCALLAAPVGAQSPAPSAQSVSLQLVGQIGGSTNAIVVRDGRAYAGIGPRVVVLDVTDPAHPTLLGQSAALPKTVQGIALADLGTPGRTYALVADTVGLHILDVMNPSSISTVGFCPTTGVAYRVAVISNYAVVPAGNAGWRVIDIHDPSHPTEVGSYVPPTNPDARDLAIVGSTGFFVGTLAGLHAVDLTDPVHPSQLGQVGIGYSPYMADGIAVQGAFAYVVRDQGWGFDIFNISNPAAMTRVGYYDDSNHMNWKKVRVVGVYAFVAQETGPTLTFNISDPTHPTFVNASGRSACMDLFIRGTGGRLYLYEGHKGGGVDIIDITAPGSPTTVGGYVSGISPQHLALSAKGAVLTGEFAAARGVDLSYLNFPRDAGGGDASLQARDVAVSGRYAYLGTYPGMQVVDVSNPAGWVSVGQFDMGGVGAHSVAVLDNYAYLAMYLSGLFIANASDPAHPVQVGHYPLGNVDVYDIALRWSGGRLYALVACFDRGVQIVDVTDPAHPFGVTTVPVTGYAVGIALSGAYAYLACYMGGFRVMDIRDMAHPVIVGANTEPTTAFGVAVRANLAYVANLWGGLRVYDVTDPAHPLPVITVDTPGSATDVVAGPGYVHVADYVGGLIILRQTGGPAAVHAARLPVVER